MTNSSEKPDLSTSGEHQLADGVNKDVDDRTENVTRPRGWMYRSAKIGSHSLPWYASPPVQLGLVSVVCFLCPGMYNALTGLGGGGRKDVTLADHMNTALYSTFAVVGFAAGAFVNRLGVRITLAFGGIGYCIYAVSLLVSVHKKVDGFNIFAGALLGICAAFLWTAQGTIMLSYPFEEDKGRYFAWFWAIFHVGSCLGSLIPLGEMVHTKENVTVSDGTYIGFIVLMFVGAIVALFVCDGKRVIRSDGSKVILKEHPSWKSEILSLWTTIKIEPSIVLLFPMFWSSNWFYPYQHNSVNGAHFSTRTKALNGVLFHIAHIIAATCAGQLLDIKRVRRSIRARAALIVLFSLTMIVYGGGYEFQKTYTRESDNNDMDWTTPGYVGPMFLYFFYGVFDAFWQGTLYWLMGALSNSGRRAANYVGFYKGIQSAGMAVMWAWDSTKPPFMTELASNWIVLAGSLVIAAPLVFWKVKDHADESVDRQDANSSNDRTSEDVERVGK